MELHASPLAELLAREPIFHRPAFASSLEDFAALMADDYWEVGASGAVYNRDFILEHLARNPPVDAEAAGWRMADPQCRPLAEATWLLTYTLYQGERKTRRATVWRRIEGLWQIIYHQGTLAAPGHPSSG